MRKLASWSFRHRWVVVGAWLAVFVILFGVTKAVGTGYSNNFTLPDTESTQALELLQAAAPEQAGDTEQVVIGTSGHEGHRSCGPNAGRGDARRGRQAPARVPSSPPTGRPARNR